MRNKANQAPRNRWLRSLPGLLVSLLALLALYFFIDVEQLKAAFGRADFVWVPAAAIVFLGTVGARAKAWRTLLEERASYKDAFFVLNQGYLLNNVLPFRLGELGRALLLGERSGLSFWQVLSTVVVERIFDVGFAAGLVLTSLPLVAGVGWARPAALVAGGLVLLGFLLLFALAANPAPFMTLLERLTKPWPKLQAWLAQKVDSFLLGFAALKSGRRFVAVAFWLALAWAFNLAWYFVLMHAFFDSPRWIWAVVTIGLSSMGVALPSSPSYIGVLEGAVVAGLSLFGLDSALALAYALVAHAVYFVMTGVIGAIGFTQQGQSLGHAYQQLLARAARTAGES